MLCGYDNIATSGPVQRCDIFQREGLDIDIGEGEREEAVLMIW